MNKKHLYIVVLEFDEDSEYFTEMTEAEAKKMERLLRQGKYGWKLSKIKEADGFNKYESLMKDFREM